MDFSFPLLLIFAIGPPIVVESQTKCHLENIDKCLSHVSHYISEPWNAIPMNSTQVQEQCQNLREMFHCIDGFMRRCFTTTQKQLARLVLKKPLTELENYCKGQSEIANALLQNAACLKEVATSSEMRMCVTDIYASLDMFVDFPDDISIVGCCAYKRFRKCEYRAIQKAGCGNEAVDLSDVIRRISIYLIVDNLCECMENSALDECFHVLPPPGSIPLGRSSNSPLARLFEDFMPYQS